MTSKTRKAGFNVSLNGYRGCCAFLVFLYHAGNANVIDPVRVVGPAGAYFWSSFRYGVEMFFMISGFVILGSLFRHATIPAFLRDRFIRIYSAWAPALIAVAVVCAAFRAKMFADVTASQGLGLFVANFFLLPPLLPVPLIHWGSWSLTYEWVFYLAASTGLALSRRYAESRWATIVWFTLCAAFVGLFPRALFFLTGVLVFSNAQWFESRRRFLRFPLLTLLIFLVSWRYTRVDDAALNETLLDWVRDGRIVAAAIGFLASLHMFASVVVDASKNVASFLQSRPTQFMGNISYSFYLWHALVMSAVKRVVTPYLVPHVGLAFGYAVFVLVSLAIAVAVSWASWTLFEQRFARVMRRVLSPGKELASSPANIAP